MALITSNGTGGGLASATTTWAGGVVPAALDDVTIAAGDVVTRDNMAVYKSLTVNGTDKASRLVSSGISCAGNFTYNDGAMLDLGTVTNPLPAGITTKTDCMCVSSGQYSIKFTKLATLFCKSADSVLQYTTLISDTALGGMTITVTAHTGWKVGHRLLFEDDVTNGNSATPYAPVITSITGNIIGLSIAAPRGLNGTTLPIYVANLEQPIWFGSSGGANTYIYINRRGTAPINSTVPVDSANIQDTMIENSGRNGWAQFGGITFDAYDYRYAPSVNLAKVTLVNCFDGLSPFSCNYSASDISVVATDNGHHVGNHSYSNSVANIQGFFTLNLTYALYASLPIGTLTNIIALNSLQFWNRPGGFGIKIDGGIVRNTSQWLFDGGSWNDITISAVTFSNYWFFAPGSTGRVNLLNCMLADPHGMSYWPSSLSRFYGLIANKGGDARWQALLTATGVMYRDYLKVMSPNTPVACIQFEPRTIEASVVYETLLRVLAGSALVVSVLVDRTANYNGSSMPTLTIDGAVLTSQSMTNAAGAVETLSVVAPVSAVDYTATIRLSAIGTAGYAWFDDLTIAGKVKDIGQDLFAGGTEISNVIDITDTLRHFVLTGLQPNTEVRVYRDSDGVELFGVENSGTTFDYAYNYTAPVPITVNILNVQYVWEQIKTTLTNASTSIPIQQRFDRNYL